METTPAKEFAADEFQCIVDEETGHLGQGSFGTVRLAFHKVLNSVAIKCFPIRNANDEKGVKGELDLLHRINHANVLRIFGWTKWSSSIGIVMEFLPGGNLGSLVENNDVILSIALRLRFCYEIAEGLSFLHNIDKGKKLTHGDMKPENVVLTKDLHCKIADFGGSRISTCSSFPQQQRETEDPTELTIFYAAPERLTNPFLKLHPNQDVYSFAIIIHMVLTRKLCLPGNVTLRVFANAVARGARPDTDEIENMVEEFASSNGNEDSETVKLLKVEMIKSWNGDALQRPTMVDLRDEMSERLKAYDFVSILHDVAKALKCLKMSTKGNNRNRCVSLSQLSPPMFQTATDSGIFNSVNSTGSLGDSNNDLTNQFIKLLLGRLTDGQRVIKTDLSKMAMKLQENNLSEAEVICKNVIANIKDHPPKPELCKEVVCDLIEAAAKCAQKLQFGSCPALLACAIELCKAIPDPDAKLISLNSCGDSLEDVVVLMYKKDLERIIKSVCIPLLQNMLGTIKDVSGAAPSVKVQAESLCLYYLGRAHIYVSENASAARALNNAIILRVNEFGEDASKLAAFGRFFTMLANAEKGLGKIKEAERSLQAALKSFENAEDMSPESKHDIREAIEDEITQLRNATTAISMESLAALLLLL